MKHVVMAALGLTAAALVTGNLSVSAAQGNASSHGKATGHADLRLGHNCQMLTLVNAQVVDGHTEPVVCVVRDTEGKRFYRFSGVLRFVAGHPVQAQFGVSNDLPLNGTTFVPVAGYQGASQSHTYYGYGVIKPDGQIKIQGTRRGVTYTVAVIGQIPVAVPSGQPHGYTH